MNETTIFRVSAIPILPAQRASDQLVDAFAALWNSQGEDTTAQNYFNADVEGRARLINERLRDYSPFWRAKLVSLLSEFAAAVQNCAMDE